MLQSHQILKIIDGRRLYMLQIDKEVLELLFPYNPTGEDIDAIQAVKEWEESNRRIKVLRGNLSRVNHQLDSMRGK